MQESKSISVPSSVYLLAQTCSFLTWREHLAFLSVSKIHRAAGRLAHSWKGCCLTFHGAKPVQLLQKLLQPPHIVSPTRVCFQGRRGAHSRVSFAELADVLGQGQSVVGQRSFRFRNVRLQSWDMFHRLGPVCQLQLERCSLPRCLVPLFGVGSAPRDSLTNHGFSTLKVLHVTAIRHPMNWEYYWEEFFLLQVDKRVFPSLESFVYEQTFDDYHPKEEEIVTVFKADALLYGWSFVPEQKDLPPNLGDYQVTLQFGILEPEDEAPVQVLQQTCQQRIALLQPRALQKRFRVHLLWEVSSESSEDEL